MIAAALLASTSRNAGGLFESVRRLHQKLQAFPGVTVPVFGLHDRFSDADNPRWLPLVVDSSTVRGPEFFGYSPELKFKLAAANIDLLQVHGIWQYPSAAAVAWHRQTKRPYMISPHGMLDPWAVKNSHWKKMLAHLFYEGTHLRGAACIRALCESEAQAIRAYGLKNPICVIPNGIDVPGEEDEELSVAGCQLSDEEEERQTTARKHHRQQTTDNGPRILLFLGRLHPKKGLVNALKAWAEVRGQRSEVGGREDWQFVIAGWDQGGHEAGLKRLCTELGLAYDETPATLFTDNGQQTTDNSASVIFTGPTFGEQKDQLLRRASAFILPSFSEGLPMSVLEAWSYRLPVLMTDHCNLPEGFSADAALRIGTDVTSIAEGMRLLLRSPSSDLRSLGTNGHALVERQFTWRQIAAQMKEVYDWVLGGGEAPDCVRKF